MAQRIKLKDLKYESSPNVKSYMDLSQFVQSTPRNQPNTPKQPTTPKLSVPTSLKSSASLKRKTSLKRRSTKNNNKTVKMNLTDISSRIIIVGKDDNPNYIINQCFPGQPKPASGGHKLNVRYGFIRIFIEILWSSYK